MISGFHLWWMSCCPKFTLELNYAEVKNNKIDGKNVVLKWENTYRGDNGMSLDMFHNLGSFD